MDFIFPEARFSIKRGSICVFHSQIILVCGHKTIHDFQQQNKATIENYLKKKKIHGLVLNFLPPWFIDRPILVYTWPSHMDRGLKQPNGKNITFIWL